MSNRLAQSLNELAEANAAGLLNDDEYRILRQSAFDRHSAGMEAYPNSPLPSPRKTQDPSSPTRHLQGPPPKKGRLSGLFRRISLLQRSPSESSLHQTLSLKSPKAPTSVRQSPCPSPASSDADELEESSQSIRQHIVQLDAERDRLLDAFSNLEDTARARFQPKNSLLWPSDSTGSICFSTHSSRSLSSSRTSESMDCASLRSTKSSSTTTSKGSQLSSAHTTLSARYSIRHAAPSCLSPPPTSPKRVRSQGNIPLGVVVEMEPDDEGHLEAELADIERRREMVLSRYHQRREYLKAKLKGAELREKLMRH